MGAARILRAIHLGRICARDRKRGGRLRGESHPSAARILLTVGLKCVERFLDRY